MASAIHEGTLLRDEVHNWMQLTDFERLREEDPATGMWASAFGTHVVGQYSRFEVDLNRPRDKAVYRRPEDAWGLSVYPKKLPAELVNRSLQRYDAFYAAMEGLLWKKQLQFGQFVILDLHTYNHMRSGPDGPPANQMENPEVNIGTGTLADPAKWFGLIDRFMTDLREFNFDGSKLDVRENVKFKGGAFANWAHQRFPGAVCVLSIEFKKFFMDEWTGEIDSQQVKLIRDALLSTVGGLMHSLETLK